MFIKTADLYSWGRDRQPDNGIVPPCPWKSGQAAWKCECPSVFVKVRTHNWKTRLSFRIQCTRDHERWSVRNGSNSKIKYERDKSRKNVFISNTCVNVAIIILYCLKRYLWSHYVCKTKNILIKYYYFQVVKCINII